MVTEPPLPVRDDLTDLEPYESPQLPARVRLNTNESPYPPPPELLDDVFDELRKQELNRYPDHAATALHDALSAHVGWPREGIWIANGSNEVFMHLFLAYGGVARSAMVFEPTYSLHTLIPRITGTGVVAMMRNDDLEIEVDEAAAAVREQRPDVVIVCSPNNPTGLCEPLAAIVALLESAPGLVVVDEAYGEFADPGDTAVPLLTDYPHLVVVKTLSKSWRLAGARIGYMLGAPAITDAMARVRLPYNLSTLVQIVGLAALARAADALGPIEAIRAERRRLQVELQAMGVRCWPSRANFVLFEVDDAAAVWQALLDKGVLVRSYTKVPALENCLRVTAGRADETDAFLQAMREVLL
jgi:histidinol-phosphate aminotransferase